MYYVYALFSNEVNRIYIGSSSNPIARLESHNSSKNKGWTAKFRPWIMIYSELLPTKQKALQRERQLKSYKGREFIRSLIR
jgi:putative endonuclease